MRSSALAARSARDCAINPVLLVASIVVASAYAGPSQAGPCTAEIDRVQAQLDLRIDAEAGAGRSARESSSVLDGHQPTPESILKAEESLGEGRASGTAAVALARARMADRAGDVHACETAVANARRALER